MTFDVINCQNCSNIKVVSNESLRRAYVCSVNSAAFPFAEDCRVRELAINHVENKMSEDKKSLKIWYMRDNHTFCELPLNVDEAVNMMRKERDAGHVYGMLCGPHSHGVVHAKDADTWSEFESSAINWLENVVRSVGSHTA